MRQATLQEFDSIWAIMETSFPVDERRPVAMQRDVWSNSRFHCYVLEEDGQILGFMTIWQFEGWAYGEHLAVNPALRNQGLGSRILQQVLQQIEGPLCLEVEPPDTDMARRRIDFYKRNGFFLNAYPYIQPAYAPDQNPVPLLIMTTEGPIDETTYENMRDTLYREVYRKEQAL